MGAPVFLLENPVDRGAWWAILHGVTKSQTQLSMHVLLLCSDICLTESKKKRKKKQKVRKREKKTLKKRTNVS